MGKMKELFMEYQQQMSGSNADLIDDEYNFQEWIEQKQNDELHDINNRIRIKYSDMDIESVLQKVLGDANPLVDEIQNELNNLNNIRNGYFD
jgi:hypothetical protein